jgi:hypothetical protein
MSRPLPPQHYSCTIRGQCDPDWPGDYDSLEQCQSQCQGSEAVDLIYLILSYDWDKATQASIPDQQELLKREFGLRVPRDQARRVISFLANRDISSLLHYSPVFAEYLEESLTSFELFLLEASEIFYTQVPYFDWRSYEKEARKLITRDLNKYDPSRFGLDSLAHNLTIILTTSLSIRYYSVNSQLQLQTLTYAWLPELFRVLAPEKYEELYQ